MPSIIPIEGDHHLTGVADAKRRMDMTIALNADVFDKAAAYDGVILIGGFAAFFTLWSGMAAHLGKTTVLASGGLMLVSVLLYIAWHIYRMLTQQHAQMRYAKIVSEHLDPAVFEARWEDARNATKREFIRMQSHWPYIYWPCVATGVTAALILGFGAFAGFLLPGA
jgi:hypothetical protein